MGGAGWPHPTSTWNRHPPQLGTALRNGPDTAQRERENQSVGHTFVVPMAGGTKEPHAAEAAS